jgi:tetratricopeptide (TPR) repeat protein
MVEARVVNIGDYKGTTLPDGATTGLISGIGELVRLGVKITGQKVTITNEADNKTWRGEKGLVLSDVDRFCRKMDLRKEDFVNDLQAFKNGLQNNKSKFDLKRVIILLGKMGVSLKQIMGSAKFLNGDEIIDALLISLNKNPDEYKKPVEVKAKPNNTPKQPDEGIKTATDPKALLPKECNATFTTKRGTIYAYYDKNGDGQLNVNDPEERGGLFCIIKGQDGLYRRFLLNDANIRLTAGSMIWGNSHTAGTIGKEQFEKRDRVISRYASLTGMSIYQADKAYRSRNTFIDADFGELAKTKQNTAEKIKGISTAESPKKFLIEKGCSESIAVQVETYIKDNRRRGIKISDIDVAGFITRLALRSNIPAKMRGKAAVPAQYRFDALYISQDSLWNWLQQDKLEYNVSFFMKKMEDFGLDETPKLLTTAAGRRDREMRRFLDTLKRPGLSETDAEEAYQTLINDHNEGCRLIDALFSNDKKRPGLFEFYLKNRNYLKAYALLSKISGVDREDEAARLINACLKATDKIEERRNIARAALKLIDDNYVIRDDSKRYWTGDNSAKEYKQRVARELRVHSDVVAIRKQISVYEQDSNGRSNKWGWKMIGSVSPQAVKTAIGKLEEMLKGDLARIEKGETPKYSAETRAYARMALAECYLAKAKHLDRIKDDTKKVLRLREPSRGRRLRIRYKYRANKAYLTAARHFRAAYLEYDKLQSETESSYYKDQGVEALTQIGNMVSTFHGLGLHTRNQGVGLKTYKFLAIALAAEIPTRSKLRDPKDQQSNGKDTISIAFKKKYTIFKRTRNGTPWGRWTINKDQQNPFIDPLKPSSKRKVKRIVRRRRKRKANDINTRNKPPKQKTPKRPNGDSLNLDKVKPLQVDKK